MPWFNVDDGFSNSKPVMRIPRRYRPACIGVWTLCGAWSAKELTDGFIPNAVLEEYGATDRIIEMLIDAELWERGVNGVNFRNWSKWQPTKARVTSHRLAEAERKRHWRKARQQAISDQPEPNNVRDMSRRDMHVRPAGTSSSVPLDENGPSPSPSPSPSPLSTSVALVGGSGGKAERGTRLPDGWQPTKDVVAQMRSDHPHVDLKAEHAKFCDYWRSQSGAKGRKTDWNATWRNWIRRAAEQVPNGRASPVAGHDDKVSSYLAFANQTHRPELEQ